MKALAVLLLFIALSLFAGACQDADITAPVPAVGNLEGTPPSATGVVSRGIVDQWWWIRHGASNATVILGVKDITAPCNGEEFVFDGISFHTVASPSGALHALLKSTVHVEVYPAMAINCTNLNTVPRIASGHAKFLYNDNQYMGKGPGAHVYGVTVSGRVQDEEGQAYHLLARAQLFTPPWGDEMTPFEIRMLKIDMTPIH